MSGEKNMDSQSKCIINLATGRYVHGQARLAQSIPDVTKLFWQSESEINAPLHSVNPYAFKVHGFRFAQQLGFRYVLWLDASVWAINDTQPIFDHINTHGYIMQYAGHHCGRWANDNCLDYFKITREEASEMKMYGNAGFLGLDLYAMTSVTFLLLWELAMKAGAFIGSWDDHRHDMVCGSIIANQLEMTYESAEDWLIYASPETPVKESIILKAQGF